jgi:two-component system response regulator (stage 0 sporulation protein F)
VRSNPPPSPAAVARPRRREPLRAAAPVIDVREPVDLTVPEADDDLRPRILIVEDEPDIREWLRVALQQSGWRVNCAPSVKTALEMANRLHPNLVLLDQRLPDGKGMDCARTLRSTHPEMRLLMFSAYLDLEAEAEAESLGMQTISKVDGKSLFDVLRAHQLTLAPTG